MKKILLTLIVFFSASNIISQVVPIAEIKLNDANGLPLHLGETFTVAGVVTSSNQFGSSGPGTIQDESAGISVFGFDFASSVNIGDSVTLTGVLSHFNGLTEFDFTQPGSEVTVHSSGHYYDTTIVTVADVITQQWDGFEAYESRLIRINNLSFSATGTFAGGTNYEVSDGTGLMEVRIDNDVSSIIGTPIPEDPVDIIGVLGQYDPAPPYNSGYQLLPRNILDLDDGGTPVILLPVVASNITTSSFTVYFNTARNGNSKVKYGLTTALELDSVVINEDTTYHVVPVTGLEEFTTYYFRAYSTNTNGTSSSSIYQVTTASGDTTTGTINVYFNFSVDTSVAIPGNNAKGNVDFADRLIQRINLATYSIDMALYSFQDLPEVVDALIIAKNRGVKIRVVYDDRNTQNSMQSLIDAGIPYIKRTAGLEGIMHNKFFVFDARDTTASNDWVWTGSWNVTANESGWKNNALEINDPLLANAFKTEFEEMWGSSDDIPNPSLAKFGIQKTDNTPHDFSVGGRDVQLYFSPSDGTTNKIINQINSTDYTLYMALYVFTRDDIASAIIARSIVGVDDIRGVIHDINAQGSEFQNLMPYAEMLQNPSPTLHHKYAIMDAQYENEDPVTVTGSHNWSSSAEEDNDENTLVIHDYLIANQYLQEYKKRYNEAGGTGTFIIPSDLNNFEVSEFSYSLFQNYPNPFNPVTTIRFELPFTQHAEITLYDILGRKVRTLYNRLTPAGITVIDFNAEGLSSGVYFYKITAGHFSTSKKLIIMR
ncbi:MAG: hypothetical protein Kow0098_09350 [Ignavibacteriaceae bacterium]